MKKALIIQEDIIILKILERLLQMNFYDCKAIRTISDLDIIDQTHDFDLIISEILFDGIAPLDFVYQLKEIILHKSLIIVTNMGQARIKTEILDTRKVDGFFAVPFDLDRIQKLITWYVYHDPPPYHQALVPCSLWNLGYHRGKLALPPKAYPSS